MVSRLPVMTLDDILPAEAQGLGATTYAIVLLDMHASTIIPDILWIPTPSLLNAVHVTPKASLKSYICWKYSLSGMDRPSMYISAVGRLVFQFH